ncbi:ras-related protein rab11 [Anaeramoeba flamelloides]|uniref:Ras-related protein rab11 n=1 Tax=Anaeramoeba flamelloides TaxID=1746091 RepID=A0AAV7YS17_9EUKA|nr:ras-related protein rab11 [Anaeramoeba flamelloides]KAJ6238810.1 ras-related protein rab11 [Anaeramoeba flamelloides]
MMNQHLFKIILIGDSGVGKSNILSRFCRDEFTIGSKSTIGVEFATKNLEIDNCVVTAQVWEKYRAITNTFYRGAKAALLIYSIEDRESFDNIQQWLSELEKLSPSNVVLMLVGNKNDLEESRAISFEEAAKFANENGILFLETSAKNATNIDKAFNSILTEILRIHNSNQISDENMGNDVKKVVHSEIITQSQEIDLNEKDERGKKGKGGCC